MEKHVYRPAPLEVSALDDASGPEAPPELFRRRALVIRGQDAAPEDPFSLGRIRGDHRGKWQELFAERAQGLFLQEVKYE